MKAGVMGLAQTFSVNGSYCYSENKAAEWNLVPSDTLLCQLWRQTHKLFSFHGSTTNIYRKRDRRTNKNISTNIPELLSGARHSLTLVRWH